MFFAIMAATPEGRIAKLREFDTSAEADAHVAAFLDAFPDAFTFPGDAAPLSHWLIDMAAKSITIVPPPPPDFDAIDAATVDAMLLESGVMRALGLIIFEIGKAGKTGNWSFFDGVADLADFKALFASMIR